MRRLITVAILQILMVALPVGAPDAIAQSMVDYTAMPPFVSAAVQPNVLLLVDNSGSMNNCAYQDAGDPDCLSSSGAGLSTEYTAATTYYGYFDATQCYQYASSKFSPVGAKPCAGTWDGNFLNWSTMRRLDITKWVMTGGLCNSIRASENSCTTLRGQDSFNAGACCQVFYKQFDLTGLVPGITGVRCIRVESGNFYVLAGAGCSDAVDAFYFIRVDSGVQATGVIQQVGNKARFGLMVFDDDGTMENGAEVRSDIGANLVSMVNAIEGMVATSSTPLAESLYEAARYFAQIKPTPDAGTANYSVSPTSDPYCFGDLTPTSGAGCRNATQGQFVPCCKSFVMLFTDGQPTNDTNIPAALQDYAHTAAAHGSSHHCGATAGCTTDHSSAPHTVGHPPGLVHDTMSEHHDNCSGYYGGLAGDACVAKGSHYLDDVAYWMHTTDLRQTTIPVIGDAGQAITGVQNITFYGFFAFGQGGNLLSDAAKVGGFKDLNGDNAPGPDSKEWDADVNGVPDTFFESGNAFTLRERLLAAITDILKRSASGTSVSILATSAEGDGALYQGYFYPSRYESVDEITWLGYLRGLFLDSSGNLREDTNQDAKLVLSQDRIVDMVLDPITSEVKADLYDDANEDGVPDTALPSATVPNEDIVSIWEAGKTLALRDPTARSMYTFVDVDNDGVVDDGDFGLPGGEALLFASANAATLQPYLRAASGAESTNIIDFIRGAEVAGYRGRCLTIPSATPQSGCTGSQRVWKLGDIVYSTPTVVAAPKEQYDLLYGDATYKAFRTTHNARRNVVYVGANDGMLHAFNAGIYTAGDDAATPETERGGFAANPSSGNGWGSAQLGDELWAFVPYDNLPHLKWLTDPAYTHVFYVDLKPKATDVRIFNDAATGVSGLIDGQSGASHPNGWGTILIVGMRYGGGAMDVTANFGSGVQTRTFRSAYYALDVTDPERPPKLLWRFTDPNMGFSTSYPAIVHFKASGATPEKWFVVVGSGADNNAPNGTRGYDGSSNQAGHVFIANLITGSLVNNWSTDNNSFMGDPSSIDGNLDYNGDVVYIGNARKLVGSNWTQGKMYRLVTNQSADPTGTNWTLSTVIDQDRPVLAAPSVSKDALGNFWVFFGTGRFLSTLDKSNSEQQTAYGIRDACWNSSSGSCPTTYTLSDLLDTSSVIVATTPGPTQVSGSSTACGGTATCAFTTLVAQARLRQGWYVNLTDPTTPSERILAPPIILGGMVLMTSFVPNSDICALLGDSFVYALYYETGTAYYAPVIGTEFVPGETNKKKADLGKGMPTTVGFAVGKEDSTGCVQTSTGQTVCFKYTGPEPRSGVIDWRQEGDAGGATTEVQTIYRHMVK